jgi:hypothetical protein
VITEPPSSAPQSEKAGKPESAPEAPAAPPVPDVTQGDVNGRQEPPQGSPEGVSKAAPSPTRLDDYEERRWRTLVEADAGKYGQALRQADRARLAWERTVRDARNAGFDELGILSAAARVRIGVPEREG